MTRYGIRADGRMVMRRASGEMRLLGVTAKRNGAGRWQYRDASAKAPLIASGMHPEAFIAAYWFAPNAYDAELGFTPEAEALT